VTEGSRYPAGDMMVSHKCVHLHESRWHHGFY
jgi:hypothetical protein